MTNTRKRHTRGQVVRKLGRADRMFADVRMSRRVPRARRQRADVLRWRNQYGGLNADDAKRLEELEKAALKAARGKFLGPGRRGAAVTHLIRALQVSERVDVRMV